MAYCPVYGCSNSQPYPNRAVVKAHVKTLRFHGVPPDRLTEFSQIVGKQLSKNSKICSNHFVDGKPTIEHPFPMLYLKDGAGSQALKIHNQYIKSRSEFGSDARDKKSAKEENDEDTDDADEVPDSTFEAVTSASASSASATSASATSASATSASATTASATSTSATSTSASATSTSASATSASATSVSAPSTSASATLASGTVTLTAGSSAIVTSRAVSLVKITSTPVSSATMTSTAVSSAKPKSRPPPTIIVMPSVRLKNTFRSRAGRKRKLKEKPDAATCEDVDAEIQAQEHDYYCPVNVIDPHMHALSVIGFPDSVRELNAAKSAAEFTWLKTSLQEHIVHIYHTINAPEVVQAYLVLVSEFRYGDENKVDVEQLKLRFKVFGSSETARRRDTDGDRRTLNQKLADSIHELAQSYRLTRPAREPVAEDENEKLNFTIEPETSIAAYNHTDHEYGNSNLRVKQERTVAAESSSSDSDDAADLVPRNAFQAKITAPAPPKLKPKPLHACIRDVNDTGAGDDNTKTFGLKRTIEMFSKQMDILKQERDALVTQLSDLHKKNAQLLKRDDGTPKLRLEYEHFGVHVLELGDHLVVLYTGLPSLLVFNWLFALLEVKAQLLPVFIKDSQPIVATTSNRLAKSKLVLKTTDNMSLSNQFLLVLMKLRLNCNDYDLAFRFNVCVEYVTHVLNVWLPFLGAELSCLLQFVDPLLGDLSYPACFRDFTSRYVAAIIDFIEVPVPRTIEPSKKRGFDTASEGLPAVRALIAYAANGSVMFVSRFQPGGRRLKDLFKETLFLQHLESGLPQFDNYPVTVICGKAAHLKWPEDAKVKFELSPPPEQGTPARDEFDRIVRRVDDFAVLRSEFATENVPYLDYMLTVCAALINVRCSAAEPPTDDQQETITAIESMLNAASQAASLTGSAQSVLLTGTSQAAALTGTSQAAALTGSAQGALLTGTSQAAALTGTSQAAMLTAQSQAAMQRVVLTGTSQGGVLNVSSRAAGFNSASHTMPTSFMS